MKFFSHFFLILSLCLVSGQIFSQHRGEVLSQINRLNRLRWEEDRKKALIEEALMHRKQAEINKKVVAATMPLEKEIADHIATIKKLNERLLVVENELANKTGAGKKDSDIIGESQDVKCYTPQEYISKERNAEGLKEFVETTCNFNYPIQEIGSSGLVCCVQK